MRRTSKKKQRGAALILTVIVIMVLTTLGMAMVAFTTTEERTATTYRDSLQTRALAEAGVRVVQEMFRTPTDSNLVPVFSAVATADDTASPKTYHFWGSTETIINTQLNEAGIWRKDRTGATPAKYSGSAYRFFFPPFRNSWAQTFGGTYSPTAASDIYDLRFNCHANGGTSTTLITNSATNCFLDTNINSMLTSNASSDDWNLRPGKITDISFYGPPAVNSTAYGITTVRVTAEKYDDQNNLLARETVVALIGDRNPEPSVLGNGDIRFITQAGQMCGDGCENIHANGDADVGTISGGLPPMVTATGDVNIVGGSSQSGAKTVVSPEINPWDDAYKPTNATDLDRFYLVTSGPLPAVWTSGGAGDNPASRACAGGFSTCQDYGLEYPAGSTVPNTKRLSTDVPHIYKWNPITSDWDDSSCASKFGNNLVCNGVDLLVTPADDTENLAWTDDTASIPYNPTRLPMILFDLNADPPNGVTLLVDGKFQKTGSGGWNPQMTVISVGTLTESANTDWWPASTTQRAMWISGRDIDLSANCCTGSNVCATNLANNAAQGIIASHEQIAATAQTALAGIIIAESRVNHDPTIGNTYALDVRQGDHDYSCGVPSWPWVRPTIPEIFSLTTANN